VARDPDRVEIGRVARAHGIRGEVLIVTHDPASTTLADVDRIWVAGEAHDVRGARPVRQGFLVALDGIDDRNAAELLRGARVEVERTALDLRDGEVLLEDLIGLAAVRADGTSCGTVVGVDPGVQVRLVIHDQAVERLVPLVDALVPGIDVAAGTVTVAVDDDWPSTPLDKAYKPR
jgi:16S rRNA processing protein RimM